MELGKKVISEAIKKTRKQILLLYLVSFFGMLVVMYFWCSRALENGMYYDVFYDFIMNACSYSQIDELREEEFIDQITTWKAMSDITILNQRNDKSSNDCGLIIYDVRESIKDDLNNTQYSQFRMLKQSNQEWDSNSVFLDNSLCVQLKLKIGDVVSLELLPEEYYEFTVAGIYLDTSFASKYTAMIPWTGTQKEVMRQSEEEDWLSGAFVKVKDKESFYRYYEQHPYVPEQYMSDMKSLLEESEYQEFLNTLCNKNWSNKIQDVQEVIDEYNETGLFREKQINLIQIIVVAMYTAMFLYFQYNYEKRLKKNLHIMCSVGYSVNRGCRNAAFFTLLVLLIIMIANLVSVSVIFSGVVVEGLIATKKQIGLMSTVGGMIVGTSSIFSYFKLRICFRNES